MEGKSGDDVLKENAEVAHIRPASSTSVPRPPAGADMAKLQALLKQGSGLFGPSAALAPYVKRLELLAQKIHGTQTVALAKIEHHQPTTLEDSILAQDHEAYKIALDDYAKAVQDASAPKAQTSKAVN